MTTGGDGYRTLIISPGFLESLIGQEFSKSDQRRILRAMTLLDMNERHPSLRVHLLTGELAGTWSASASDELRITFERLDEGLKRLLKCSRHYRR